MKRKKPEAKGHVLTEHSLGVARGWQEEGMGSNCLLNSGFPFGVMQMFGGWRLHNTVNVLSYHFIAHFKVVDLCYTQLAVISC